MAYLLTRLSAYTIMRNSRNFTKGFTIIELLVVIAIFGIMIAVAFANYREIKISSRNATRLEETRSLQNALDLYHLTHRAYPGTVGTNGSIQIVLPALATEGFIPALPIDPSGATDPYYYCPGDNASGPQAYVLRAKMELEKGNNPAALSGDLDGTIYGCDCADANLYYCLAP